MDHSLVSPFEVNLAWLDDPMYMQRLYRQIQSCKTDWWLYDLRSRLYFMLCQCHLGSRAGGVLQLQSYPMDEISIVTFGVSCGVDVIGEVTELLQADPELCKLECYQAARDRGTGQVGLESIEVEALCVYAR